jgi:translation initiation factor 1
MKPRSSGGLVYSTDSGRMCPACRQPVAACSCRSTALPAARPDGVVHVGLETKGRGGKAVTLVRGLGLDAAGLADWGKRLRTACGTGGSVKDGVLELQGDHRDRVVAWLEQQGRKAKRVGG